MKLVFDVKNFVEAINWATKGLDMKEDSSFVSFYVNEDQEVRLISSNSRFYKKSKVETISVDLDSDEAFEISVDAQYIQKLSSALGSTSGEITLSKDESKKTSPLIVKSSHGKFTVPVVRKKPETDLDLTVIAEVSEQEFFDALTSLAPIANSSTDSADAMGTVALKIGKDDDDEDKIVLMATDAFTLGEIVIDCDINENDLDEDELNMEAILIPKSSATMIPVPKDSSNSIQLVYNKKTKRFGYVFIDNRVALFSLDLSKPVIYKNMKNGIVNNADSGIIVELSELKKAINVISSLAWDEVDVRLVIDSENSVVLVKDNTNSNSVSISIKGTDYDGEDEVDLKFMRNVIKSAFSPIKTSDVKVMFSSEGKTKATVFRPVLEDGEVSEDVLSFAAVRG